MERTDGWVSFGFSCMAQVCNYHRPRMANQFDMINLHEILPNRHFERVHSVRFFYLRSNGLANRIDISPPMSTRINPFAESHPENPHANKHILFITCVRTDSACTGFDTHTQHAVCFDNVFAFGRRNMQISKVI